MSGTRPSNKNLDAAVAPEHVKATKMRGERILIRLVSAISRMCTMHANKSVGPLGLSVSQAIVLGELFSHSGCRQEDLRAIVALDKGNITRALQKLEESGLVLRKHDAVDRRVVRVHVTKKALALEREMFKRAGKWDEMLTSGFTRDEHETLVNLLLRMEINAKALAQNPNAEDE